MSKKDIVWLGTPVKFSDQDFLSSYTSRIGGTAALFRETEDYTVFSCPKCKSMSAVSLLAQIYAPLDVYDRVLYVFTCAVCSSEEGSFCFALRSQNFNPSYVATVQVADHTSEKDKSNFFEEDTDWGDGANKEEEGAESDPCEEKVGTANIVKEMTTEDACNSEAPLALVRSGSKPPVKGVCYPCFGLEVFEEPPKLKTKSVVLKNQLREAQQKYGEDVVETTLMEDDDEPLLEKRLRKYVERIGRAPSQCVRWGPNQEPLRSSVVPMTVPHCQLCGHERRYEFQLTSPIIYFLTREKGEKNHFLHFGNVLVFTCSANCNTKAYASEYCIIEEAI